MDTTPKPTEPKPSVGRIVHFHASEDAPAQAALVVGVNSDLHLNLVVWNDSGTSSIQQNVFLKGSVQAGTTAFWTWPPRV